ncbi:hypothetical protein TNCV_1147321 [Trichonephila clavipes]|nr:hypothetical protein TNCV_1147321 [Trichonephila clavipes]
MNVPHHTTFVKSEQKVTRDWFFNELTGSLYEMPVSSLEDLIAPISVAAGRIRDMPEIYKNVKSSMQFCGQTFQ